MTLPDVDAVFEGSGNGSRDAMSRQLAHICVLASAVDKNPEDVLNPSGADFGVEHAFGLPSLDEINNGIAGRHSVSRHVAPGYSRIAEDEQQAVSDRDHRGDRPAHGLERRALLQGRPGLDSRG